MYFSGIVLYAPIVKPCLFECVVTYFSKIYSLKEHGAVLFNKGQNLIFSGVAGSI